MDEMLQPLYRQYLQQIVPSNIRYPSSKLLATPDIQLQIHRYLFDEANNRFLPPADYQRRVLKKIIIEIERELARSGCDGDDYSVSDELMARMGILSAVPSKSESESAQTLRVLSYFAPTTKGGTESGSPILIRESPNLLAAGSNVGLRTWEACLRLAYYLCSCPSLSRHHLDNKGIKAANIIELGAGTGLLSLICAQALAANHVVATDGLPHVVSGISANIELNGNRPISQTAGNIVSAQLDWTNPSELEDILSNNTQNLKYDYILGADITYHPELFDPLANIIRLLKTRFPMARVLIAATIRNEATLLRFQSVCITNHGLRVRDVDEAEWQCPPYVAQTGLFHEQAFPITIMDIDLEQ